jgi:hypothetical protein
LRNADQPSLNCCLGPLLPALNAACPALPLQITMLDKNAKHKVTFKDVAGCDEAKVGAALRRAVACCCM